MYFVAVLSYVAKMYLLVLYDLIVILLIHANSDPAVDSVNIGGFMQNIKC